MFMKYSGSGKLGHMSSLVPERLRRLALDALEEADLGPVRRSCAPSLALAYLASLHPRIWSSGEPFRDFWRALSFEGRSVRRRALEQAFGIIHSWAEVKRNGDRAAVISDRARGQACASSAMRLEDDNEQR
jgi:hypothetical protein